MVEFAKGLSAGLPLLTLADILGVPHEDRMLMFDWAKRVFRRTATRDTEVCGQQIAAGEKVVVGFSWLP